MTGMCKKKAGSAPVAACATLLVPGALHAAEPDLNAIRQEIAKRHDEGVKRLRDWIATPSIAAEDRG